MVFLISDFELPDDGGRALGALDRAARPVGAGTTSSRSRSAIRTNARCPTSGIVTLEDAETGDVVTIDTGRRRVRERFAALAAKRDADMRRTLRRSRIETLPLDTTRPYLPELLRFFESRERRLA